MMPVYDEQADFLGMMDIDIKDSRCRTICIPFKISGVDAFGQLSLDVRTILDGTRRLTALRVHREHLEILKQCRAFHPAAA